VSFMARTPKIPRVKEEMVRVKEEANDLYEKRMGLAELQQNYLNGEIELQQKQKEVLQSAKTFFDLGIQFFQKKLE